AGNRSGARGARLDRQRDLLVAATLVPEVSAYRLSEQGMAKPQPAAAAEHQPGVQDGLLRVVAVGQRQRSELGGGQLPARGREYLDQVTRRAGQRPGRR